jgi:hypothetical protein
VDEFGSELEAGNIFEEVLHVCVFCWGGAGVDCEVDIPGSIIGNHERILMFCISPRGALVPNVAYLGTQLTTVTSV